MKLWKKILLIILSILIIISGGFYIYTLDYYHALPIAQETLNKGDIDYQKAGNIIVFNPDNKQINKGIIFYPGGKVDYISYIPLMKRIAKEGYTCVLIKMPFNLAVFDQNAADKPIEEYDNIDSWYIAGHSLGGAMGSVYASKNQDKVDGLILLGAYPSADLSSSDLKMLSIYGSNDEMLSKDAFEENKKNAPKDTRYIKVKGGNHAYYGNYGEQDKDGKALITPEEQQEITVKEILKFLK